MTQVNPVPQTPTPPTGPRFREAYQRLLDEIRAVPATELVAINIDIPTAVGTALGVLPEITALRPRIVSETPQFDIARFDKLEAYTQAAWHAHSHYLAASAPAEPFDKLVEEATTARLMLYTDALALAQRGFVDGQRLQDLKGPNGFRRSPSISSPSRT